jgi:hypothetical protein
MCKHGSTVRSGDIRRYALPPAPVMETSCGGAGTVREDDKA